MDAANKEEKRLRGMSEGTLREIRETHEDTVARPHIKKKPASLWKEDWDGAVMSSGVLAISYENRPNPVEKRQADAREQIHGPRRSIILPTAAAKGYCPIMPL